MSWDEPDRLSYWRGGGDETFRSRGTVVMIIACLNLAPVAAGTVLTVYLGEVDVFLHMLLVITSWPLWIGTMIAAGVVQWKTCWPPPPRLAIAWVLLLIQTLCGIWMYSHGVSPLYAGR